MRPHHRSMPPYLRALVGSALAVAVGLVLVTASPHARPAFAAGPSAPSLCDAARDFDVADAYEKFYVEGANAVLLQFGDLPAVERLYVENQSRLFDAFVALHARGYAPADLAGPLSGFVTHARGPRAASGIVMLDVSASPGTRLATTVAVVCEYANGHAFWKVPLDDFCRALRAANADQQCSKGLIRKAKKWLPRSLAKAPTRAPTVVTTVPTTVPTTAPAPTPLRPDGLCPFVGQPCDSPLYKNTPDPDCVCSG